MVKLGDKVTDAVTGFTGIATARTEFLHGCVRICVEAAGLHDGKAIEPQWFDEQRLTAQSEAKTGGPGPSPPSRDCPVR